VIFIAIFWKKIFVHHQFVHLGTRRKQPAPNNFGLKIYHFNLKRSTLVAILVFLMLA